MTIFLTIGYRVNMVKASACAVRRGSPEGKGQGAVERRRSTDPTDEHEAVPVADNKCSMKMLSRGLYLARKGTSWPLETSASQKNTTPDPRRTSTDSREGREAATTVRSQLHPKTQPRTQDAQGQAQTDSRETATTVSEVTALTGWVPGRRMR